MKDRSQVPAFAVEVRIRNNRILRAIKQLGYPTQAAFCTARNVQGSALSAFVTFRLSPVTDAGEWTERALHLADALFADPEDLWPKEALAVRRARISFEATAEDLRRLSIGNEVEGRLMSKDVMNALRTASRDVLTPMERMIIQLRFEEGETLEQIGNRCNLGRERIRSIENDALTKLHRALTGQHPEMVPGDWLLHQ